MRSIGLVYMAVFVVVLTAFLHDDSTDPAGRVGLADEPIATSSEASAAPLVLSVTVPARIGELTAATPDPEHAAPAPQPAAPPQEATRPSSSDRRYRRGRRDRYTGRIPTPDEWEAPEGPIKIALQAGHWRADEAPRELSGLKGNGTRWRDVPEWQANLEIARRAGAMLEELGYEVEILPAVVPPGYRAHLFVAIHADGSGDPNATGYRVAAPRQDATGRADRMASHLVRSYGEATGIPRIPTATRRMSNYYAFNFRRYEHALHPMTIGVILETGFLTSERDRRVILDDPGRAARGIVDAVTSFPETRLPSAADGR